MSESTVDLRDSAWMAPSLMGGCASKRGAGGPLVDADRGVLFEDGRHFHAGGATVQGQVALRAEKLPSLRHRASLCLQHILHDGAEAAPIDRLSDCPRCLRCLHAAGRVLTSW